MIRILCGLTLLSSIVAASVGCTSIQAVGPFAKDGSGSSSARKTDPGPPDPVIIPAPTPAPPACLVRPEQVNANNTEFILQQFSAELETDRKNTISAPITVEVSQYKDGVKIGNE